MKYALGLLGVAAAGTLLFVSAAMNWRFGFSLGKSEFDAQIYGAASAAADGLKALLPFFIMWAVRQRSWMQAASGVLVWLVCTSYSLTSSLGFSAINRAETLGERTIVATQYKTLTADLKTAKEKLAFTPQHRSVGAVQASLDAGLNTSIKTRKGRKSVAELTENCTLSNFTASKHCPKIQRLRSELASAQQSEKLESKIASLESKLEKVSTGAAIAGSDPQSELLTKLTGIKRAHIETALIVLVSMLVEIGSGLGFFVVLGDKNTRTAKKKAKQVASTKAEATPVVTASANDNRSGAKYVQSNEPVAHEFSETSDELRDFYASRIEKSEGSSITASKLYESYCSWAETKGKEPMTLPAFGRQFSEIGIQKAKIAGRIRYIGVKLASNTSEKGLPKAYVPRAVAV